MNHELIMLREAKRMRSLCKSLTMEARYKAIKSYAASTACNGTMGQIEEICNVIGLRDDCLLFCVAVCDGLKVINGAMRTLLAAVYFKRTKINDLAARYSTSRSTVYRKLFQARCAFRRGLDVLGYSENWFMQNYPKFDFIAEQLKNGNNSVMRDC